MIWDLALLLFSVDCMDGACALHCRVDDLSSVNRDQNESKDYVSAFFDQRNSPRYIAPLAMAMKHAKAADSASSLLRSSPS